MTQVQITPYLVEYLSRVAEAHQRGDFDVQTDIVREVGEAPPEVP
jgi:NAD(P)H dehydrogenase (quinone)